MNSVQERVKHLVLHFVKLKYNEYLLSHKIQFIDEDKIEQIIHDLYIEKRDELKEYLRQSITDSQFADKVILEIFNDEELCKNRLILEIKHYQKYKKLNSDHYKNSYDVVLTPDDIYGLGLELDIINDSIKIKNFKRGEKNEILPAEKSQIITIGDKIIEINSLSFIGRTMEDVIKLLQSLNKNSLSMKLQKCTV